ncbi:alpha/beta hydrolase fold domain-containing protein [Nocardiopsis changdeensis]|uniref:alpha/beta hydrolase fold domain-containing protein n=1 Tax=Nocardiopsis changdeensis TaxID=2831969 RepID=UPI003F485372
MKGEAVDLSSMDVHRLPTDPEAAARVSAALTDPAPLRDSGGEPAPGGVWANAPGASRERGVLLYVYGGGFVHRDPGLITAAARRLSAATGRPALAVYYRLAPDHPFPAPLDDVVAAYRYLLAEGFAPGRVAVVAESSGAALALSALLVLKAAGDPPPGTVVTQSAVTDMTLGSPSLSADTPGDPGVDRALIADLTGRYLGGAARDRAPQSPLHGDLAGLPPLLMVVGGAEALLDDTLRYAAAAHAAGTRVRVDVLEGLPHAFSLLALTEGEAAGELLMERVADWIDRWAR